MHENLNPTKSTFGQNWNWNPVILENIKHNLCVKRWLTKLPEAFKNDITLKFVKQTEDTKVAHNVTDWQKMQAKINDR